MTARLNSHSRYASKSRTYHGVSIGPSRQREPEIIIASIHRRQTVIGPNTHTNQFEKFLETAGIQFRVLTPFSSFKIVAYPVLAARGLINLVSKPVGVWWFLHFRRLFLRLCLSHALQQGQAAVIYARCPNSAQAALEARKNPGQKVVMAVHFNRSEAEEWYRSGRIRKRDWVYRGIRDLESELLPNLDGLHFVSQFMRNYIHEHHPEAAKCKSIVLPNFMEDPGSAAEGEPKGDLISIGSLEPRKNQAYLIQVLHEARLLGHRYSLTLVGQGPDRRRLQCLARELGVLEQVHFLGFKRDAARLLPMYRAYAHSALIENFPFVLVESAAYGLPMLASPVGGVPEIFFDGEQGFYWPLANPKEGARKLIALLEDKAMYTRLAEGARKLFEANYTTELVGPQLLDFLLEIAG